MARPAQRLWIIRALTRTTSGCLIFHRIGKRADPLYLNGYGVARLEPARRLHRHTDAMRSPGKNDSPRQQRRAPAQEGDQGRNIEDHVVGVPVLHHFAVQYRADGEGVRIGDFVGGDEAGAERREGVERLAAAPLAPPHLVCQSRALTSLAQV